MGACRVTRRSPTVRRLFRFEVSLRSTHPTRSDDRFQRGVDAVEGGLVVNRRCVLFSIMARMAYTFTQSTK